VYDRNLELTGASSTTTFNGQAAQWYQYTDSEGNILTKKEDDTYFYINDDKEEVGVDAADVVSTLKDGDTYTGTSSTEMEILYGKPMAKSTTTTTKYTNPDDGCNYKIQTSAVTYNNALVRNLQRVLSSTEENTTYQPYLDPDKKYLETTNIVTTYTYDPDTANLTGVSGSGTKTGYLYSSAAGWHAKPYIMIKEGYEIILGKRDDQIHRHREEKTE